LFNLLGSDMKIMRIVKLWGPVIIWCCVIFSVSNTENVTTGLGAWDFPVRKLGHISEYFILTFLLYRAFSNTFNLKRVGIFVFPAGSAFLYAMSDEFHQLFVPTRFGTWADVLIDTLGIVGFYVLIKFKRIPTIRE